MGWSAHDSGARIAGTSAIHGVCPRINGSIVMAICNNAGTGVSYGVASDRDATIAPEEECQRQNSAHANFLDEDISKGAIPGSGPDSTELLWHDRIPTTGLRRRRAERRRRSL